MLFKIKAILILFFFLNGCSTSKELPDIITYEFDPNYTDYALVLNSSVKEELVDYKTLKENREQLDKFIGQLAGLTPEQFKNMTSDEKKALWINAYNGITLRSIIDHYPVKSIKDINGVWNKVKWHVAGQDVTLDDIEHKILRIEFKDPRIHFAINCASIGCPPLLYEPFSAELINNQLDKVSSDFVNHPTRNKFNYDKLEIETTKILSWFGDDFKTGYATDRFNHLSEKENAVLNFIFNYTDSNIQTRIGINGRWELDYYKYDWSLNDIIR